jgi:UDP-glucose-4-epimerase GalE
VVQGDLLEPADIQACVDTGEFRCVFQFASRIQVGESIRDPLGYYRTNLQGTLNLLQALEASGPRRLVFSSSAAVYGQGSEAPLTELAPLRPINPYGHTKAMAEQVLADLATATGFPSVSLRYFNAAGCDPAGRLGERHEPETHLIPRVLAEALRLRAGGNPAETALVVDGKGYATPDGTCIRDYVHVEDLCRAHLLAAERLLHDRCEGAEAYNLGSGTGWSVLEVIEACRRVTGLDLRYRVGPARPGSPARLVADASRARAVLQWTPRHTDLDALVATAWRWMLAHPPAWTAP